MAAPEPNRSPPLPEDKEESGSPSGPLGIRLEWTVSVSVDGEAEEDEQDSTNKRMEKEEKATRADIFPIKMHESEGEKILSSC